MTKQETVLWSRDEIIEALQSKTLVGVYIPMKVARDSDWEYVKVDREALLSSLISGDDCVPYKATLSPYRTTLWLQGAIA